eukprot:478531-Rhodomonas_salina.1
MHAADHRSAEQSYPAPSTTSGHREARVPEVHQLCPDRVRAEVFPHAPPFPQLAVLPRLSRVQPPGVASSLRQLQQHVLRLDVCVDDPAVRVQVVQPAQHIAHDRSHFRESDACVAVVDDKVQQARAQQLLLQTDLRTLFALDRKRRQQFDHLPASVANLR